MDTDTESVNEAGRRLGSGIFLRHGDALLAVGDLTSARLFYERAAETGHAATKVAKTLDPLVLKAIRFPHGAG